MQFDRLRLIGFKSFVEPSDVIIQKGLTGVVGPNGCGKSNLVEALRWVMGEASYKAVRGTAMDDVIFAGSGRRAARDTAEVTLFLDNSGRTAPADMNNDDALEVTRQITRGIGSDYRVNGKNFRARDVQLLFADAATGSRSPSMVRQGQVAELIAAKPTDRRNVLEEAAGISGLRARKHEATLKLNASEMNLSRLDTVADEVTKQMETLRRQARQAERYAKLGAEIRAQEATVHHVRWTFARAAARDAAAAEGASRDAMTEAASARTRTATAEAAASHALPALREAEAQATSAEAALKADLARLDEADRQVSARLKALKADCEALAKDLTRHDNTRADATRALEALEREASSLEAANEGADDRILALEARASALAGEAEMARSAADAAIAKAAEVLAARSAAEAHRKTLTARKGNADAAVARLTKAHAAATGSDTQRAADAAAARSREAAAAEVAADEALVAAEAALPPLKTLAAEARQAVEALAADVASREAEAGALRRLTATTKADDAVVEDCVVAPGYEVAFAVALGDGLSAPVRDDAPIRWTALPPGARPAPAKGTALVDHVDAPPALERALSHVFVVDDAGGQEALSPGETLVTREGALWRWDGYCRAAGAPSAAAERLAQKNRLGALEAELAALCPARDAAKAEASAASEALNVALAAERDARRAAGGARNAASEARRALQKADAAAQSANANEMRLAAELAAAKEQSAAAAAEVAAAVLPADGAEERAARDTAQRRAQEAREAAATAGNAMEAERRATLGRMKRLDRINAERRDWRTRVEESGAHRADIATRLQDARAAHDALSAAPSETAVERRRLVAALEKARLAAREAADARKTAEAQERAAQTAARSALDALAAAREAAARAEERAEATARALESTVADLREALSIAPEGAARLAGLAPDAPLPDRKAAEARLEKLKADRERLGSVNLLAAGALQEIEERHGTMAAERDDLLAAIARLREGIFALNKEARQKLVASFDQVNAEFQRLFTHLFNGGEASLQLTEAADPLDAGLDIIARPPGKKPQSLSLLSGGEQTLTATALIFAVFLTNPAPICVLDEIDAPLDDANVERFCALLDEMTARTETRFMIITHNPITMARMHRLYGVTMVEKGVSQLVSVSLEAAEALRESA
ncbi:MAG: chromosome segregation protein SMC [Pseudomonadota bacterium]